MAHDLIPPPSPAGKPGPDGGGGAQPAAREPDRGPEDVLAVRPDAEPVARVESSHRARFGLIMGALIGLGMAAVVILVVALASPDRAPRSIAWSSWKPASDDAYVAASEIAEHVGRQYRLDDGSQLLQVESGPIQINDVPLSVVARQKTEKGDIFPVRGKGLWYILNGLGEKGSIKGGTPSPERLAVVKREALELALYTFHYVKGVDHVITVLPPPPPDKTAKATDTAAATTTPSFTTLLFRPEQLTQQLSIPLDLTLDPKTPNPKTIRDRDAQLITQFTEPSFFNATVQQDQVGGAYLVLERPAPAAAQLTDRIAQAQKKTTAKKP